MHTIAANAKHTSYSSCKQDGATTQKYSITQAHILLQMTEFPGLVHTLLYLPVKASLATSPLLSLLPWLIKLWKIYFYPSMISGLRTLIPLTQKHTLHSMTYLLDSQAIFANISALLSKELVKMFKQVNFDIKEDIKGEIY